MSAGYGVFFGKLSFASNGGATTTYLTVLSIRVGPGNFVYLPSMQADSVSTAEYCILYQQGDGSIRIQMSNLMWIGLDQELGRLTLTPDFANAAALQLSGTPIGQAWQIQTSSGWQPVVYYPGTSQPVLTINDAQGAQSSFQPGQITASLAVLNASKNGQQANLSNVVFDGASLSGVDFTQANFQAASLQGSDLSNCKLDGSNFQQAQLSGVNLNGASLDGADLSLATLATTNWGAPASAKDIILTKCKAQGAILGGQSTPLDCSGAQMGGADFSQADLRGLLLTGANLSGAVLLACHLDKAMLDKADLSNVLASSAVFKGCSMKNIRANNGIFVRADFSQADLSQAQMGAKNFLFVLAANYATDLQNPYPDAALQNAFHAQGINLSPQAPIQVLVASNRWVIDDASGPYLLINNGQSINVFLAATSLRPAVLYAAICQDCKASGVSLAGADLRGVQWFGNLASLDHADLEGAALAGSLLASIDLTQAFLSGTDMSNCVLVQAKLAGCIINSGSNGQAFSLEAAQFQGADFVNSTMLGAVMVDAGVALAQGVSLFTLPLSDLVQLTPANVANLAPTFAKAGYVLGSTPTISSVSLWNIDNSSDPDTSDPASYQVRLRSGQLNVFDGTSGVFYFTLPNAAQSMLANPHPNSQLISYFSVAGFGLVATATITSAAYWQIKASDDASYLGSYAYGFYRVVQQSVGLQVFGASILLMRDWAQQYPGGLAFSATNALQTALSTTCIGPNGYPYASVSTGLISWQDFVTA